MPLSALPPITVAYALFAPSVSDPASTTVLIILTKFVALAASVTVPGVPAVS